MTSRVGCVGAVAELVFGCAQTTKKNSGQSLRGAALRRLHRNAAYYWRLPSFLRRDAEFNRRALRSNPLVYKHFDHDTKTALALEAVQAYALLLEHVPDALRGDEAVVRAAIEADGFAYKFALLEWRHDLLEIAVRTSKRILAYVPYHFLADRTLVLTALASASRSACTHSCACSACRRMNAHLVLSTLPDGLRHDREVVLVAVTHEAAEMLGVPDAMADDDGFVAAIAECNARALVYASAVWWRRRDVVTRALAADGELLLYAPHTVRSDAELVRAAMERNPTAFVWASAALRRNRDFVLWAVRRSEACYVGAGGELYDDPIIRALAVSLFNPTEQTVIWRDLCRLTTTALSAAERAGVEEIIDCLPYFAARTTEPALAELAEDLCAAIFHPSSGYAAWLEGDFELEFSNP